MPGEDGERRGPAPKRARRGLARLTTDVLSASQTAVQSSQVRGAMTRAAYSLGVALAVLAAVGVHAVLHVTR
jgi:hypothetical protein